MKTPKPLILFFAAMLFSLSLPAQDLIVTLLSGESSNYPVQSIRSMKFPGNTMAINLNNGTTISFNIANIFAYHFDMSVSTEDAADGNRELLKIYPNPASERVQIEYRGKESAHLEIDILDGSGKLITRLYAGPHTGETRVEWNPRAAAIAPGQYLCRMNAGERVFSGKIIVQ